MIITKKIKSKCYACEGKGCKICKGTGKWIETHFYHIFKNKKGKLICFDGDTVK